MRASKREWEGEGEGGRGRGREREREGTIVKLHARHKECISE